MQSTAMYTPCSGSGCHVIRFGNKVPCPLSIAPIRTRVWRIVDSYNNITDACNPWTTRAAVCRAVGIAAPKDGFNYLDLNLPPPAFTKIAGSKFVKSSAKVSECPPCKHAEFAVIGRSNVGKSSIINMLTSNPKLAKVSKEPGMTKMINHFQINDNWYLVDLPGYGFAKTASKTDRADWLEFTKDFFIHRDSLAHVFLLVDSSLPPQQLDVDCANWLGECEVPFAVVFTKLDNKKKDGPSPQQNIKAFKGMLAKDWELLPWCFETSSKTGAGRNELLGYISSVRQLHEADSR